LLSAPFGLALRAYEPLRQSGPFDVNVGILYLLMAMVGGIGASLGAVVARRS